MNLYRVLVVEDNELERGLIVTYLKNAGHVALEAVNAEQGFKIGMENEVDACLIDWMLPGDNGLKLVQKFRSAGYTGTLVILTSKTDLDSQLVGMSLAIDDYWLKPVPLKLIAAKLSLLLRRRLTKTVLKDTVTIGPISFDSSQNKLTVSEEAHVLGKKEADTLRALLLKEKAYLSKEELLAKVWKFDYLPESRSVDNYIMKLRRSLIQVSKGKVTIETKRRSGYRIILNGEEFNLL
jgi:DNA-binding response OmpR family regulator